MTLDSRLPCNDRRANASVAYEPRTMARRRGGFTLVEALIIMGVIGVLAAFGIPSLLSLLREMKVQQSSQDVMTLMRAARYRAIKESQEIGVLAEFRFSTTGEPDRVVMFTGDDPTTLPANRIGVPIALPRGVYFQGPADANPGGPDTINEDMHTDATIDGCWVVFRPDGSASLDETGATDGMRGAVRMANDQNQFREIRVDPAPTGRIKVLIWDGSAFVEQGAPS